MSDENEDRLGMTEEQWAIFQKLTHGFGEQDEEETDLRSRMTAEQWERFQAYTRGFGEQDENGVDISLLRENLKLTPTERLEKMRRALALVREVRRAGAVAGLSSGDRTSQRMN